MQRSGNLVSSTRITALTVKAIASRCRLSASNHSENIASEQA
jgi:hypothetical protein